MDISITPRTLQEGVFTRFDVSEINDEMYLAYIIDKIHRHSDLRIDMNSYNHFFFYKEEGVSKMREWVESNKEKVKALDKKYEDEAKLYYSLYDLYSEYDYWVKANYRMLRTDIPIVDVYIAKETLLQVIYVTLYHGDCKTSCYFHNLGKDDKLIVDNKLKEMFEYQKQLSKLLTNINKCKVKK